MRILKKPQIATLLIIWVFIYSDIICENVLVIINDQQTYLIATILLFGFLTLQMFFAAIQSGLSDFFGRKESLIISFTVSTFSLLCVFLYTHYHLSASFLLILALAAKALFGNTIPISFAAIADIQEKNRRKSFALASGTYSLAFITLTAIKLISTNNFMYILISSVISLTSIAICIYAFQDASDKTAHPPHDGDFRTYLTNLVIQKTIKLNAKKPFQ